MAGHCAVQERAAMHAIIDATAVIVGSGAVPYVASVGAGALLAQQCLRHPTTVETTIHQQILHT